MVNPPREEGQSLIEVLAALGVVVLVILTLIIATTFSIRNATFAKNQSLATGYAQEGIEWIRLERDRSWDNLNSGAYCLNSLTWQTGSCGGYDLEEIFKREAVLAPEGSNKFMATVIVSWQDAKGTHKSELSTYLTNW